MINVILFGNVPLATWVAEKILKSKYINLLGAVCDNYAADFFKNHGMGETSLYAFCLKNKVKCLKFDEALIIAKKKPILGISIRYNKIFKENYYTEFNPGIINLHGGELPRYRGANIANYAILEKAKKGAGTMHFISSGIDEGDVVKRFYFNVSKDETAYSFFIKALDALKEAFSSFLNDIDKKSFSGRIKRTSQDKLILGGEKSKIYYKKGIEKYREIEFKNNLDWDDVMLKLRAFYFPGHPGIYLIKDKQKIELKYHDTETD